MSYLKDAIDKDKIPQNEPLQPEQVPNSAGGYSFAVDKWDQFERFLILGSEGGSYYASERALTVENAQNVRACIEEKGKQVVEIIHDISTNGRAPKQDPALFALAMVYAYGDRYARAEAYVYFNQIVRTASHLFMFVDFVRTMRGWGRALKTAVQSWYTQYLYKDGGGRQLAYQMVKYGQRYGYTHRDLLRLSHPQVNNAELNDLLRWCVVRGKGSEAGLDVIWENEAMRFIADYERLQRETDVKAAVDLITRNDFPREAVPSDLLAKPAIWEAMLHNKMPLTALLRNLRTMAAKGVLDVFSTGEQAVVDALNNHDALKKARVHPIQILSALTVYQAGGPKAWMRSRSQDTWTVSPHIVAALEGAFYAAFDAIEPTNKRTMLALDVSGSMGWGTIAGVPGLTPRVGSAAMAMATVRSEPKHYVMAFSSELVPVNINRNSDLSGVLEQIDAIPMGGTNAALPMLHALEKKMPVDVFIVYTDSETWSGSIHPVQALRKYRAEMGIPAKLVVVGMVANEFTIADPADAGMLDVVGFDTAAPSVIASFVRE